MLGTLQKHINANQLQRAKHPTEPAKFMQSEFALHSYLETLLLLATEPSLYPVIVSSGALPALQALLSHENADIVTDVLLLLSELTDPEGIEGDDEEDGQSALVTALCSQSGLELAVAAMRRVQAVVAESAVEGTTDEEDGESKAVDSGLALMDHLLELQPEVSSTMCAAAGLLPWLLAAISAEGAAGTSSNRLYASELLGSLLATPANAAVAGELDLTSTADSSAFPRLVAGEGAVEALLAACARYCRKQHAPSGAEEEETVANLFTALRSCMLVPANQDRFRRAEGIVLMLKAIASGAPTAPAAIALLDFAVQDNGASAKNFVTEGGLGVLFAVFSGKGAAAVRKTSGNAVAGEFQESAISTMASLALLLPAESTERLRFIVKFLEGNCAKCRRLVELLLAYQGKVAVGDAALVAAAEEGRLGTAEEDADVYGVQLSEDERVYLRRMEYGLFTLQKLECVLAALCVGSDANEEVRRSLWQGVYTNGASLSRVALDLRDMADRMVPEAGSGSNAGALIGSLSDDLAAFAAGGSTSTSGAVSSPSAAFEEA
jgi:beta-catenin-like protein 1